MLRSACEGSSCGIAAIPEERQSAAFVCSAISQTASAEGAVMDEAGFWTRARRHMLGYGGDFVPFVPTRAEGSFLFDASGRRVLDFTSGQMSAILGHSHPEVVATVRDQVGRLDHLFSSMLC